MSSKDSKSLRGFFLGLFVLALGLGFENKVQALTPIDPCSGPVRVSSIPCFQPLPPPPLIKLSETSLAFGSVTVGSTSAEQSVTVTNVDSVPLTIGVIETTVGYTVTGQSTCSQNSQLPAGQSCQINVAFEPQVAGANNGFLTIGYIDSANKANGAPVSLSGKGMMAAPVCGDGNLDAGEECDDGNTASGDGCSAACVLETTLSPAATPATSTIADPDPLVKGGGGCSMGAALGGTGSLMAYVLSLAFVGILRQNRRKP